MNQSQQTPTPEELKNLESDPVWTLLDQASQPKASAGFVDSVMDQISSAAPDNVVTSPSFWQRYALPMSGAVAAGVAACLMFVLNAEDPQTADSGSTAQTEVQFTVEELAIFEQQMSKESPATATTEIDLLAEQLKEIENQDPFFMSAEDINVLVTM